MGKTRNYYFTVRRHWLELRRFGYQLSDEPRRFRYNFPNIEPGRMPVFPFGTDEPGLSYIQSVSSSAIIIAAIVLILLLALIFSYISSVMEFVFVESLVRNEVKFWAYSRRFLGKGFYLLLVRLALGLVFLALFGIAALPLVPAILENPSDFAWPALLGGIFWIAGVIIVLILLGAAINSLLSLAIPLSIYRKTGFFQLSGLFSRISGKAGRKLWFTGLPGSCSG